MFGFTYVLSFFVGIVLIYYIEAETVSTNECIRIVRYTKNITSPYSKTVQVRKTKFCFNIPFVCTTYETKTKWSNRTEAVEFTKAVKECCVGYKERNGTCKPICEKECIHGNCVSPDRCLCDAGWTGVDCTEECDGNHYGHDCDEYCLCQNGATCNRMNGTCYCAPGFTGIYCESICHKDSFGNYCENICRCKNGAACKMQEKEEDYSCICKPGYIGKFCEMKCYDGTYGEDCKNICVCEENNTDFCSHLDGQCNCSPGYKGKHCQEKCDAGFWGIRCENTCDCGYNVTFFMSDCDHITGDCYCLPGWYGPQCTEKCPADTWGKDCLEACPCLNNGTCDPETGGCLCLQGWLGSDCSIRNSSSDGAYTSYCNFQCDYHNNATCNQTDGLCICSTNGNHTTCPKGDLNSAGVILFIFSAIGALVFICVLAMIIARIYKRKSENDDFEIDFDERSTANVIENQVLPEFSSQQFMNEMYGECEVHAHPTSAKSTAFVNPIRTSKPVTQQNSASMNETNISTADSKNFVNLAFEALFSSKENKEEKSFSANAVVTYSTSKGNPDTTDDEKCDKVSLYKISIYDDGNNPEEHHYANPSEILNDGKDESEN